MKASPTPIILFIDEAHTMIGAGGQAGQNDAANLLKPALARGELRTIAATTWSEYKKYFEKDAALARRFQVVKVEEPSEHQCLIMMRGLVASLEKHHNVRILDEAVYASVRLSHRFLAGRQLPDKAVSILDTACARLSLGQNATPPALEDTTRQIDALEVQKRILDREDGRGRRPPGEAGGDRTNKKPRPPPSSRLCKSAGTRSASWSRRFANCGRSWKRVMPRMATGDAAAANSAAAQDGATGPGNAAIRIARGDRPDPRLRGCADCGRSTFGLDRHSRRQNAQG